MATYAIGDVQGCAEQLEVLLEKVAFGANDRLWLVGDLVNRGPQSLRVLRLVRSLGERAVVVLGNHDLHLISQHEGFERSRGDDTLEEVLRAADAAELVRWLRERPLMHAEGEFVMVHAGLLPQWSVVRALALAKEVEAALRGSDYRAFLSHMYGSTPAAWSETLEGWDRLRVIVNAMTRLRYCTPGGVMNFRAKGNEAPEGHVPWFELRNDAHTLVCGHWSAMGLKLAPRLAALDSGCVWGGQLSALRLEDRRVFQVTCPGFQTAGGDG